MSELSAIQAEVLQVVAPLMKDMEARLIAHMEAAQDRGPEWIPTVEAAKALGVCEKTIRNRIKAQAMKGEQRGNRYYVHKSELR